MAIESVSTEQLGPRYLPTDAVNRADELCYKLGGLIECMRAASLSNDPPTPGTYANVCWIADGMVSELNDIVNTRIPQTGAEGAQAEQGRAA